MMVKLSLSHPYHVRKPLVKGIKYRQVWFINSPLVLDVLYIDNLNKLIHFKQ